MEATPKTAPSEQIKNLLLVRYNKENGLSDNEAYIRNVFRRFDKLRLTVLTAQKRTTVMTVAALLKRLTKQRAEARLKKELGLAADKKHSMEDVITQLFAYKGTETALTAIMRQLHQSNMDELASLGMTAEEMRLFLRDPQQDQPQQGQPEQKQGVEPPLLSSSYRVSGALAVQQQAGEQAPPESWAENDPPEFGDEPQPVDVQAVAQPVAIMVAAPAVELPENRPEPRLPVSDTPDVERRLAVSNRDFGIRDGMRQDLEAIEIVDVKEEKRQDVPPARGFTPAQSFAAVSRDVSRAALRASNIRRPELALERNIERVISAAPPRQQQEVKQSLDTLESVIAANTDNADDAKAMEELANNLIMTTADNRDFVSLLAIPVFLATLATAARTGKPPALQGNAAMSALMGIMHVGAAWYGNWLNDTSQAPGPDAGPRPAGDDPRAANYDFDDITDQIKSGRDIEKLADDIAREFKLDIDEKSELLDEIKQAAHGEIEARQAAAAIRAITEPQARAAWGNIGFGRFIREAASAGAGTLGALSVDRFLQRINWAEFVEQRVSSAVKSAMDAAGITTAPTTFEPTTYKPSEEDEEELRREVNRPNTLTSGGGEQGVGVSQLRPEFVMLGTMWDRETPEEAAAERRQFAMYSHVREGDSGDPNSVVWQQNKQWNKNIRYNDNFSLQMQPLEYIQPYVYEYTTLHIPPMRQYIGPVNLISQLNNSVNGDNILEISNSRQLGGTGRMHDPLHVPLQNIRQVYAKLHPAPIYAPTAPSLVPVDLQYPTNTDANRFSQRDYIRYPVEGTEERMLRQPPVYRGAGIYPPHMASRSGFTDKRRFITGMGQYSDMAAMGLV